MTHRRSFFSILIGVLPIISSYSFSFLSRLDLGTIVVMSYSLFSFFYGETRVSFKSPLFVVYLYTIIATPICIIGNSILPYGLNSSGIIILLRYGKFLLVFGLLLFTSMNKSFNKNIFVSTIRVVVYSAFVVIAIQQFSRFFLGLTLSNPFLYIFTISGGSQMEAGYVVVSNELYRPSAFFLEPSWMAVYCIGYLSYQLFSETRSILDLVLTSISVVLTTSAIGFLAMGGLYVASIFFKHHKLKDFFIIVVIGITLYLLSKTTMFQSALARLLHNSNVVIGRSGVGYEIWLSMSFINKLLGVGFGNVPSGQFINGVEYLLITQGVLGCLLWFVASLIMFIKGELRQRIVVICFISLAFGVQVFNVSTIMFYFTLADNQIFPFKCKTHSSLGALNISYKNSCDKAVI